MLSVCHIASTMQARMVSVNPGCRPVWCLYCICLCVCLSVCLSVCLYCICTAYLCGVCTVLTQGEENLCNEWMNDVSSGDALREVPFTHALFMTLVVCIPLLFYARWHVCKTGHFVLQGT